MTFTASNGLMVERHEDDRIVVFEGSAIPVMRTYKASVHVDALREFFQHEKDEHLGRWRSSADPRWTAVRRDKFVYFQCEDGIRSFNIHLDREATLNAWNDDLRAIAREYIAAHPEPKPWHDAECGESWYLEPYGIVYTCVGDRGHSTGLWFTRANVYGKVENLQLDDARITAGRRIYPEVS